MTVAEPEPVPREVTLLQRKTTKVGAGLGKDHRLDPPDRTDQAGVVMQPGVEYLGIDDEGLHISVDGTVATLAVDSIVLCTGQESRRDLYDELTSSGVETYLIGEPTSPPSWMPNGLSSRALRSRLRSDRKFGLIRTLSGYNSAQPHRPPV